MDLTTKSPREVDTMLSALYEREGKAQQRLESARLRIHHSADSTKIYYGSHGHWEWSQTYEQALAKTSALSAEDKTYRGTYAQNAIYALAEANLLLKGVRKEMNVLNEEFDRRGGWTRAFLVQQPNGHVHKSMSCSTCFPTTRFAWMVAYSGQDEAQIVEDAGERACTFCYPTAPVDTLSRPTKMFGPEEIAAQQRREEALTAKTTRDAKKIANALTEDGSEFVVQTGSGRYDREFFKTEKAASQWVVSTLANNQMYGYAIDVAKSEAIGTIVRAIAAKHNKRPTDVFAQIDAKVVSKIKRDSR